MGLQLRARIYVHLLVGLISFALVQGLSIGGGSGAEETSKTSRKYHQDHPKYQQTQSASQPQQQQQQQPTTLPPLMTTISHYNYLDSLANKKQVASQDEQLTARSSSHSSSGVHGNSNMFGQTGPDREHEENMTPMIATTINNHHNSKPQQVRPPQYVDVSALVGRDRLSSNSTSSSSPSVSSSSSSGGFNYNSTNSGSQYSPPSFQSQSMASNSSGYLSPKSRSGLPECATQQVCNAIFVRMNYTQRLCECSSNYNWKCSHNLDPQDGHTIELTRKIDKRIYTQIKTCEPLREVRACKSPSDWTLLALQSERSGKAHYVVICKCPTWAQLEGPYTHNHPPYANIPGIRVYGMLCAHQTARSSAQAYSGFNPSLGIYPEFPWSDALNVLNRTNLESP